MESLDWFAKAWSALDGWHRVAMVAGLVLFVYGVFPALGQKKEEGGIVMNKPTIIVNGPAQVGNNNVQNNTTVNVNAASAYSSRGEVVQGVGDGMHHTFVRFPLTDGPWDAAARSAFEIKLSAPWQTYEIKGFPMGRMNVQAGERPDQGSLFYSTTTPPSERMVEFHFTGDRPMDVVEVGVSPKR